MEKIKVYTFDTFDINEGNKYAFSAARRIVDHPSKELDLLIIHGAHGTGKTHLLHALLHAIAKKRFRDKRCVNVYYTTAESYANDCIQELANAAGAEQKRTLREKTQDLDALLIDDIQFLADKPYTQKKLRTLLTDLHNTGKQIVISCDRPIKKLPSFDENLIRLLESGFEIGIEDTPATSGLTEDRMRLIENIILNGDSDIFIDMPLTPEESRYIHEFVEKISMIEYGKKKKK